MKRIILCLIAVALLIAFVPGCAKPAPVVEKPIVWRIACLYPADHASVKEATIFANLVEEGTKGKLKMDIYPAGALYSGNAIAEAVRDGLCEVGEVPLSYIVPIAPVLDVANCFMLFDTIDGQNKCLNREWGEAFAKVLEEKGIKPLYWYVIGWVEILNRTRPIQTVADMKGLKIRMVTKFQADQMSTWGAIPVSISSAEQYTALQQGVVDGAITSGFTSQKLYEVIKYLTLAKLFPTQGTLIVNKGAFDKLPKDFQQVVLDSALKTRDRLQAWAQGQYDADVEEAAKHLEVIRVTREQRLTFVEPMRAVQDAYVKTIGAYDLYKVAEKYD